MSAEQPSTDTHDATRTAMIAATALILQQEHDIADLRRTVNALRVRLHDAGLST